MTQFAISLHPEEQSLLDGIQLDAGAVTHEIYKKNGDLVVALVQRLTSRNAIPEHRLKYFSEAEYSGLSRGRSWKEVFERNGTCDEEILRHPHFLKFLRYFLTGPTLPFSIIEAFSHEVRGCGDVTSGDVIPLAEFARKQVRSLRMEPKIVDEEFYKLALDCGIWPSYAEAIRRSVRQIRYR